MTNQLPVAEQIGGEVVLARCGNPLENTRSLGKPRPMILIERERAHWRAMGFTTNPIYLTTGQPRTPIPDPMALGLTGPGFLWGRPTRICVLDVLAHIGWATEEVLQLVERQIDTSNGGHVQPVDALHSFARKPMRE